MIGERLGRRQNAKQTTGSGVSTFQGVTIAATAALTTASPTLIAADELITLQHKVDPAYRSNPKCAFMLNDDTMRMIRQLKDSNGRYLLDYSTLPGQFTKLLGFNAIANQQMAPSPPPRSPSSSEISASSSFAMFAASSSAGSTSCTPPRPGRLHCLVPR